MENGINQGKMNGGLLSSQFNIFVLVLTGLLITGSIFTSGETYKHLQNIKKETESKKNIDSDYLSSPIIKDKILITTSEKD